MGFWLIPFQDYFTHVELSVNGVSRIKKEGFEGNHMETCKENVFLTYPSIQDQDPYVYPPMTKLIPHRCQCQTMCCYIRHNLHATFDVMTFQIIR